MHLGDETDSCGRWAAFYSRRGLKCRGRQHKHGNLTPNMWNLHSDLMAPMSEKEINGLNVTLQESSAL